jgi:hypothetical protein
MSRQHLYRSSLVAALALLTAAAVVPSADLGAQRPRFFSDDPLQRDPETQDAAKVEAWEIGLTPDLLNNLFGKPGDRTPTSGRRTSTPPTRCRTPAGSPIAFTRSRCPPTTSRAVR